MATVPRVQIFLDGSNFYNGLREQFGKGFYNVEKLAQRVLAGRSLVQVNFYTGLLDPGRQAPAAASQQSFLRRLTKLSIPVQVFAKPLKYYTSNPTVPPAEKGVDTRIVQDLIIGAVDKTYDVAILLSGDQDFIDVVQLLHSRFAVQLETYYPNARRHLYESCRTCFTHSEVIKKPFYDSIV